MTRPSPSLPDTFLTRPVAHRGLHGPGVPENSGAAFEAAIAGGYGIELDVQISRDGIPVVFHDDTLDRMTAETGPVRARTWDELCRIPLAGGAQDDKIPRLDDVLEAIGPQAPVLVEIKDQTQLPGAPVGDLVQSVGQIAQRAAQQGCQVAVMSFNHLYMAELAGRDLPRGLVGMAFTEGALSAEDAARLSNYDLFESSGACFVSHDKRSLDSPPVHRLRAQGVPILCWTIRSAEEEASARKIAHNITFEGYPPARP